MITLKWWQLAILLFIQGLISVALCDLVSAGTTFTHLSKSVEIVDWDKWLKERDKALEFARKQGAMVFTSSITIKGE